MTDTRLRRSELYPALAMLLLAGCGFSDAEKAAEYEKSAAPNPLGQLASVPQPVEDDNASYERRVVANGQATLAHIDRRMAGPDEYSRRLSRRELLDYDLYKAVARDLYRRGTLELNGHIYEGDRAEDGTVLNPAIFDVIQCTSLVILEQEMLDERQSALQQAAAEFVNLEEELARAGYDRAVYASALARLEGRKLQLLSDSLADVPYSRRLYEDADQDTFAIEGAFAAEAEPRRKARQPDRLPITRQGGCGDGETKTPFEIRPVDGVARIIRVFSFEVCDKRRLDPWNTDKCRSWVSVRNGGSLPVSGSYRVQVNWPDGRSYRGDFTTDAFLEDSNVKPIRFTAPAIGRTKATL